MFEHLDRMPNLRVLRQKGGDLRGPRRLEVGCNDAVTDLLGRCQSASELASVCLRFGIPPEEILRKARGAVSFGQFRMAVGNRIRGIVRRMDRARREGREMSLEEAARPTRKPKSRRVEHDAEITLPQGVCRGR